MDVPISAGDPAGAGHLALGNLAVGRTRLFRRRHRADLLPAGGRYLDHRTRSVARSAAEELAALEVPRAWRVTEGARNRSVVRSGGRRPDPRAPGRADARGRRDHAGTSELDRSLLTGETLPVFAGRGAVSAGEVNLTGPLRSAPRPWGATPRCIAWPIWWPSPNRAARATPRSPTARRSSTRPACTSCRRWPFSAGSLHRRSARRAQHRRGGAHHHLPLRAWPRRARGDHGRLGPAVQARDC